ncbi:hypothetical protein SDC9_108295 [bioreactor metagenome]|uniref:Uncharacterized protein n=1 Tax=bioreactor metagenome TaxID=1076179 RepID=A0A645B7Q5_9ZZZZ
MTDRGANLLCLKNNSKKNSGTPFDGVPEFFYLKLVFFAETNDVASDHQFFISRDQQYFHF